MIEIIDETEKTEYIKEVKRRGRPKKEKKEKIVEKKKGRGRPKKIKVENEISEDLFLIF
jgi:hypothetical protein